MKKTDRFAILFIICVAFALINLFSPQAIALEPSKTIKISVYDSMFGKK
jgi:hypothetical protein